MGYTFNLYSRSFTGSNLYGSDILENHDAQAALAAHRTGMAVKVYYDPFDPARSVAAPSLEYAARQLRDALWGLAWAAATPLMVVLGLAGFVLGGMLGVGALERLQDRWRRQWGRTERAPLPSQTVPEAEPLLHSRARPEPE